MTDARCTLTALDRLDRLRRAGWTVSVFFAPDGTYAVAVDRAETRQYQSGREAGAIGRAFDRAVAAVAAKVGEG